MYVVIEMVSAKNMTGEDPNESRIVVHTVKNERHESSHEVALQQTLGRIVDDGNSIQQIIWRPGD